MSDNFRDAVKFARSKLEKYREVDLMARFESASKSNSLGVYNEKIDWDSEIEKANEDYDSFVRLKRHCARLIRVGRLEPQFENWLMDYLDDIFQPPTNPKRGAPKKHNEFEVLVHIIRILYEKFKLNPMRGPESPALSACDALSQAIIVINKENNYINPIKISSYDRLQKLYSAAKQRDDF